MDLRQIDSTLLPRVMTAVAGVAAILVLAGCGVFSPAPPDDEPSVLMIDGKVCGVLDPDLVRNALGTGIAAARTTRETKGMEREAYCNIEDGSSGEHRISAIAWRADNAKQRRENRRSVTQNLNREKGLRCFQPPRMRAVGYGAACPGDILTPKDGWVTVQILFDNELLVGVSYYYITGSRSDAYDTAIDLAVNMRENIGHTDK